jgi:hypothetical protein
MDTRTREQILERYRAHAARFDEAAAGRPDRMWVPDAGRASSPASDQPTARQIEILQIDR